MSFSEKKNQQQQSIISWKWPLNVLLFRILRKYSKNLSWIAYDSKVPTIVEIRVFITFLHILLALNSANSEPTNVLYEYFYTQYHKTTFYNVKSFEKNITFSEKIVQLFPSKSESIFSSPLFQFLLPQKLIFLEKKWENELVKCFN